jgi:hypothetical protein
MIKTLCTTVVLFAVAVTCQAKTPVTSWDQFTLVGGFKIPESTIDGKNARYATGSFDKLPGSNKWIGQYSNLGHIVEYIEPSEPDLTFPYLTTGRWGKPFTSQEYLETEAVQWLDENNVLCSAAFSYADPGTYNWVSIWNLETGVETPQTLGNVDDSFDWEEGLTYNQLWYTIQALGGGFSRIPESWAVENGLEGKTIGFMAGGRKSNGTSYGPTASAFAVGDTLPSFLMQYPSYMYSKDGTSHFETRDKNYSFPAYLNGDTASTQCPAPGDEWGYCNSPIAGFTWSPDFGILSENPRIAGPTGDVGYFNADRVSHGAGWIDDEIYSGVVYGVNSPNGYLDYDAQSDGFLVLDPSTFYDGSVGHYEHPEEYSGGPAGSWSRNLYVYDPDCLAAVNAGTKDDWECPATVITPDFSNLPISLVVSPDISLTSYIGGVYWDEDRDYLWIIITQMSEGNRYPMLVAYSINGTSTPPTTTGLSRFGNWGGGVIKWPTN